MKVDFVTLGGAAEALDMPAPTLRGWSDKLEEMNVHYLERNHRDERIFYESDIEIFRFMKEAKDLYGRKSTTIDLGYVLLEKSDEFQLRQREDVPSVPNRSLSIADLDLTSVLENQAFQSFMSELIRTSTKGVSNEIIFNVSKSIEDNIVTQLLERIEEKEKEREEELKLIKEEQQKTMMLLEQQKELQKKLEEKIEEEASKSFWKKLFN